MRVWCLVGLLLAGPIWAQQVPGLVGTLEVEHQRQQSKGKLEGCSLVYRAAFQDFAYLQGQLAAVAGNFTLYAPDANNTFLTLKVGFRHVGDEPSKTQAPGFAYLQSKSGTTAKTKNTPTDSDTLGFRMWVMPVDANVTAVIADVLDGQIVTLGFTRAGGSLDVLVPLDLTVATTTVDAKGAIHRDRSQAALVAFRECFADLASALKR